MTRLERWLMAALLVLAVGLVTVAQVPSLTPYYTLVPTTAVYSTTTCPTPATGFFAYCKTGTGEYTVSSAGVVTPPWGPSVTGAVLSIQGTVPGATGSIKLTCTGTFPATTATPTVATTAITIGVPTVTVPVTCTAAGS
jgi:hypothetical protein